MDLEDFQPQLELDGQRIAICRDTRRIAVRVARWDETHSGFGEKVRIPRQVNVDAAHVGVAELDDGSKLRVATLPMETMHAPRDLAALHAAAWYENSGKGVARVKYSVDDEGIRADGLLFSDVDDAKLERVLAASASGDWRAAVAIKRFSDFEKVPADFVGSCIVNIPGYSDTFSQSAGQKFALAASAHTLVSFDDSALTAASIEPDGFSNDDANEAWQEAHPAPAGESWNNNYVVEFFAAPQKVIATVGDKTVQADWDISPDGTIVFGEEVEVEQTWIPKEEPVETVALSASAVTALLEGTDEEKAAAAVEVKAALVAGGHVEAPDPHAARLERIEGMLTGLVFQLGD